MSSSSYIKLKELFDQGYVCAREPMTDYEPCSTKYALPIHNLQTGDIQMHYFNDEDTNKLALALMKSQKESPLGFVPTVKFLISGIPNNNINFEFQSKALLEEIKSFGYEVREKSDRIYDIKLGDFVTKTEALNVNESFKKYLFKAGVVNSVGMVILGESLGPYYAHSPYAIGVVTDIKTLSKLGEANIDTENQKLIEISSFYGQADLRSKLIVGWALLESYFNDKHTSLLNDEERDLLYKSISDSGIEIGKVKRLKDLIAGKSLTLKSPIEVIHEQLLGIGIQELSLDDLKLIRAARGQMAHTSKDESRVVAAVSKIEPVLKKLYIDVP
jgi:hypothetical protein